MLVSKAYKLWQVLKFEFCCHPILPTHKLYCFTNCESQVMLFRYFYFLWTLRLQEWRLCGYCTHSSICICFFVKYLHAGMGDKGECHQHTLSPFNGCVLFVTFNESLSCHTSHIGPLITTRSNVHTTTSPLSIQSLLSNFAYSVTGGLDTWPPLYFVGHEDQVSLYLLSVPLPCIWLSYDCSTSFMFRYPNHVPWTQRFKIFLPHDA